MKAAPSFGFSSANKETVLPWLFRAGMALCFFGHGAFGLLTKKAWLPYFAVPGIPEPLAWRLMPWIGALDICIAVLILIWPCRALLFWAAGWAGWTALLRPLSGQGWPEFFERAGNYGVPIAILVVIGLRGAWFSRLADRWTELSEAKSRGLELTLRALLAALLGGHAACALVLKKAALAHHYEVFGTTDPVGLMLGMGWCEVAMAIAVLTVRSPGLALFACIWKIGTEMLFLTSGAQAPIFELMERGGSYVVPLALTYLLARPSSSSRWPHLQPV